MAIPRNPDHPGAPLHPGEMLREDFMVPLGISANALAMALRVPSTRISEIVAERRSISADTAYRLARYFGMPAQFWMNLQSNYALAVAYRHAQDGSGRKCCRGTFRWLEGNKGILRCAQNDGQNRQQQVQQQILRLRRRMTSKICGLG